MIEYALSFRYRPVVVEQSLVPLVHNLGLVNPRLEGISLCS